MASYSNSSYEAPFIFQLKASFYPLNVLQLLSSDLSGLEQQLSLKIAKAPKFFHQAPIVIDLQKLFSLETTLDFRQLVNILFNKKLIPVGIKGGNAAQQAAATLVGLPIFPENEKEKRMTEANHDAPSLATGTTPRETVKGSQTKVITEPVRSGQQIYAQQGDLIVIAPVSQGAEVLAAGHIHVYGPLRGRALAGITGDEGAQIFCQSLESELVSIAGQYKISEDIEPSKWGQAVNITLNNGRLHIRQL